MELLILSSTHTVNSKLQYELVTTNVGNVAIAFWDDFRWGMGGTLFYRLHHDGKPVMQSPIFAHAGRDLVLARKGTRNSRAR